MAQATAERPRARKPARTKVTPDDFVRIERFITTEVLVEREREMRIVVRAMLAGVNVHMIGEPGVAKSLGLREFARCVSGARYFEKAVHGQTPADAIIGGYDMPHFTKTGEFRRNVEHYAPNAHIIFIDELPRANGPTLDATLPMMNAEERRAEANGGMVDTPILCVVTASNTWFDAENDQHKALSDRVTAMLLIEDVRTDESFKEILRRHDARRRKERDGTVDRETITVEQLIEAQAQVDAVTLSGEYLDASAELRRKVRNEGLIVSARRWVELGRMCRANAWLAGRDRTLVEDLAVVEHGLWRDKDDIPLAHKLCLEYHGQYEQEAAKKRAEAEKALAQFEEIRPQVEGTPPEQDLEQDVLTKAISASRKIDAVKDRVDAVLKDAEKQQRDAASLRELSNELLAVQRWFRDNSLPNGLAKKA